MPSPRSPARGAKGPFAQEKAAALAKLSAARAAGEDDPGARQVVDALNRSDDLFTTSSCAGRIALMEVPDVEPKRGARFVGKWHRPVEAGEVLALLPGPHRHPLWLFAQGTILHVTCRDLACARRLLSAALAAGYKASGAKSLGRHPVVEVRSTEVMAVPLARGGAPLADEAYVRAVVAEADRRMERAAARLRRLERALGGGS